MAIMMMMMNRRNWRGGWINIWRVSLKASPHSSSQENYHCLYLFTHQSFWFCCFDYMCVSHIFALLCWPKKVNKSLQTHICVIIYTRWYFMFFILPLLESMNCSKIYFSGNSQKLYTGSQVVIVFLFHCIFIWIVYLKFLDNSQKLHTKGEVVNVAVEVGSPSLKVHGIPELWKEM